jgi:integrase
MATIRPDGRAQAKGMIHGKLKYFYGSSPEEAEAKKEEAIRASRGPVFSKDPTYGEFVIKVWFPNRIERLKPNSKVKYDGQLTHHILPALGRRRLHEIGLEDMMKLKASLHNRGNDPDRQGKPLSDRERFQILALAKSSLEFARKAGLLDREDWKLVGMPKVPKKKKRAEYPENMLVRLLEKAAELGAEWMQGPLWCAGVLGLRRGEIAGLYKRDLKNDVLRIVRQRQRIKTRGTVDQPLKSDESERDLELGPRLAEELRTFWSDHPIYMFAGAYGQPIKPDRITEKWPVLRDACELPKEFDFHDLRSFAGSNLLDLGVDLATIMLVLGHAKIDTTMLYMEVKRRKVSEAMDRLDRSMTPKKNGQ